MTNEIYSDLWSTTEALLIEYPELSELWLDRATLNTIRGKYVNKDEQREYYRKRAFTAMVMEKLFRAFQVRDEVGPGADEEGEGITIDNDALHDIWRDDLRAEYEEYPDFIEFIENEVFSSSE